MPVTYNSIMIKKVPLYLLKPKVLSRKARFIHLSEFALHTDHLVRWNIGWPRFTLWESCNNTILFDYSFEGNEVNCGGGQMFTCQSSDGVQGEKSLPRNQKKETSHKSKQVESSDEQTVMEKIDATKKKMGTLVQRPIEEATLASIVLICGNNYFKMNSLLKAFNSVVNCDSFPNFQRRCIAPVFEEVLSVMNDLVEKLLRNQVEICLCTAGTFNSLNGCISRY